MVDLRVLYGSRETCFYLFAFSLPLTLAGSPFFTFFVFSLKCGPFSFSGYSFHSKCLRHVAVKNDNESCSVALPLSTTPMLIFYKIKARRSYVYMSKRVMSGYFDLDSRLSTNFQCTLCHATENKISAYVMFWDSYLEVTMHNAVLVQVANSLQNLLNHGAGILL